MKIFISLMIYIDPPYNTGKDFIYHDNRTETELEHLESTNQLLDIMVH